MSTTLSNERGFDLTKLHKIGTYVLVGLSLMSLWSGGAFGLVLGAAAVVVVTISWFWERPRIDPNRFGRAWTLLTVAYIGLSIYMLALTNLGVVQVGVYLVMYLTGAKLFQRARLDDYIQLLALSFLLLAAATAFNEDLVFGLFFVLYVIVGVVTFAVYHLRRQIEETQSRGGRRAQNLFGLQYLSLLTGLSLICFAAAVVFFFLFPRLGFGFFAQKSRGGLQVSGFSENVDLGTHGTIKTDNTVVMRVQFPEGRPEMAQPFYWRGITFDKYDGVGWSSTLRQSTHLAPDSEWRYRLRRYTGDPKWLLRQDIYLEPINSNVIFMMHPAVQVELAQKDKAVPAWIRNKGVSISEGEVMRYHSSGKIGIQYSAVSLKDKPEDDEVRAHSREKGPMKLPPRYQRAYTQLPEANARIRALAEKITEGADNDYDRAQAIARHLRQEFDYTTNLPDPGAEPPLDAFLFTHKRGHCEFFATAMVVLLRSIGIPARSVNGFMGGKWNEFDDFLAVRNADAHSWVEVYFGRFEWIGFDPTPSSADVSNETSALDGLAKFYDSLKFRWLKYVIEYDLETQVELLRQATAAFGSDDANDQQSFQFTLLDIFTSMRRNIFPMFLVALLGFGVWMGLRIRGRIPIDLRDVAIIILSLGGSLLIVVLMWKPAAGPLALGYATVIPLYGTFWGLGGRLRPGKGRRGARHEGISRLYARLCTLLSDHGIERLPSEGPEALLAKIKTSSLPSQATLDRIIHRYMAVRFGGQTIEEGELKALEKSFKEVRRALK